MQVTLLHTKHTNAFGDQSHSYTIKVPNRKLTLKVFRTVVCRYLQRKFKTTPTAEQIALLDTAVMDYDTNTIKWVAKCCDVSYTLTVDPKSD